MSPYLRANKREQLMSDFLVRFLLSTVDFRAEMENNEASDATISACMAEWKAETDLRFGTGL